MDSVHKLDHNIVRSHGGSTNQPVLSTGAASALGWHLAAALAAQGWTLRLTDIVAYPGALPPSTTFTQADLADGPAITQLAVGCGAIPPFRRQRPLHEAVAVATLAGGPETASYCATPQVWGLKSSHTRRSNRICLIHFWINIALDPNDLAMFVQVVRAWCFPGHVATCACNVELKPPYQGRRQDWEKSYASVPVSLAARDSA